jgi:nitrogen fixation/metabolism regulation signal transduction histidine kinase
MPAPTLKQRRTLAGFVLAGCTLWVITLLLMLRTAQQSKHFSDLHPFILAVNAAGVIVLLTLIGGRLAQLIRDWRRRVVGSRLEARMVVMSSMIAMLPLLLVFCFAVVFLNRGIDSWFHVEIRQGLENALSLSRAALDIRMREYLERTRVMARELALLDRDPSSALNVMRRESGASEITLSAGSRIIANSTDALGDLPQWPSDEMTMQVRQGRVYVTLDPLAGGGYLVRTAVQVLPVRPGGESRMLFAAYPIERRLGELADTVELANRRYGEKARLREPLKTSFTLTLTLVLLLSLFGALYGAFWAARRLVRPIQDLVAGTRAVGKGDFDTRLPLTSHDEMGVLVHSFNDMTKRLARAREEARESQSAVEAERANLAVILARLSTGVISLEPDQRIRTANEAAGSILGLDLTQCVGRLFDDSVSSMAAGNELYQQFVAACQVHFKAGRAEWREELVLRSESQRRVITCACTALPRDKDNVDGYVIVFDDITALLQAQRDAAWGEVARRLAHEIKNPLTPIQLSAERMRRKLLGSMSEGDAQVLDRATHTIVQQVEAMKQMVNAFSEYARAPEITITRFDLNQLVTEVVELYRAQDAQRRPRLSIDPALPPIEADRVRLRQILHNLLTNALEALEAVVDPKLVITTRYVRREGGDIAEIVTEDNGSGFSAEMIGQVFEPYVTTKPKGTGLGLAIVKKIIEEHGGKIEAENLSAGGARIRIELPLVATARAARASGDSRATGTKREHA